MPAADWAEPRQSYVPGQSQPYSEGGVFYHRTANHFRPDEDAAFTRLVIEFQSKVGLEDYATLVWNLDQEFEVLQLHWIGVYRAGEWIDLLPTVEIDVVDARTDVQSWFYDDSKDVRIILEGLEVGDVLDYAFTRIGSNPVVGDRFSAHASLGYSVRVGSIDVRLDWPIGKEGLRYRTYPERWEPGISEEDGYRVIRWHFENPEPVIRQSGLPAGYEAYPWVQFTDWSNWGEVARWALDLYPLDSELPRLLQREADRIRKEGGTPLEQATMALQFVQDRIRYISIPVGPHSYQPYPPARSAEKKYGDCKDKSLLLVLLLRDLGIHAELVLVNTVDRQLVRTRLPSQDAFDHVLVRARIEGEPLWMDPTDSHQGGILPDRYFPYYGYGLILSDRTADLTGNVGPQAEKSAFSQTTETFVIPGFDEPVSMEVKSVYSGYDADGLRRDLATDGLDSFARAYTNYYATLYDLIPDAEPLAVKDDREANELQILESYDLKDLFPTDESGASVRNFPAEIIRDRIPRPSEKIRNAPFALSRPLRQKQVIEIHLPDDSLFEDESFERVNDWFRYEFSVGQEQRLLRISHEFEILSDMVLAPQIADYQAEVAKVEEYLDYFIEVERGDSAAESAPGFFRTLVTAFSQPVSVKEKNNHDAAVEENPLRKRDPRSTPSVPVPITVAISLGSFLAGLALAALLWRRKPGR